MKNTQSWVPTSSATMRVTSRQIVRETLVVPGKSRGPALFWLIRYRVKCSNVSDIAFDAEPT
jgi:hypothetical protein